MKFVKKALIGLPASAAFGVLWLVLLNLADVSRINNYELIVYAGLVVASICIAIFSVRNYLKRTENSVSKKIGYIAAITIPSFLVMLGTFYGIIFLGLTYLH